MRKYILAHWRGEYSLVRSTLINGLVLGIAISFVISFGNVAISKLLTGSCIDHMETAVCIGFAVPLGNRTYWGSPLNWLWIVYAVWACVGILRCGLRAGFNRTHTTARKIGGFTAIVIALIFAYRIGYDTLRLIPENIFLIEAKACELDAQSSGCAAYHERRRADVAKLREMESAEIPKLCATKPDPSACQADFERTIDRMLPVSEGKSPSIP